MYLLILILILLNLSLTSFASGNENDANIDKSIFKNFNINYYYDFEGDILIKYISRYAKNIYLCYKIRNLTQKKYKILLWLLLNTKISKYDIELLRLENKEHIIQKSLYELLYSLEIIIDLNLFNKNYIKNTKFIKKNVYIK